MSELRCRLHFIWINTNKKETLQFLLAISLNCSQVQPPFAGLNLKRAAMKNVCTFLWIALPTHMHHTFKMKAVFIILKYVVLICSLMFSELTKHIKRSLLYYVRIWGKPCRALNWLTWAFLCAQSLKATVNNKQACLMLTFHKKLNLIYFLLRLLMFLSWHVVVFLNPALLLPALSFTWQLQKACMCKKKEMAAVKGEKK